jgi:hypothetical protein
MISQRKEDFNLIEKTVSPLVDSVEVKTELTDKEVVVADQGIAHLYYGSFVRPNISDI